MTGSRVAVTSKHGSRNGLRVLWCSVSRFHSPCMSTCFTSSTSASEANSGNSPPQACASVAIGEASRRGLALWPSRRVRSACRGVGHRRRSSRACASLSDAPEPGCDFGEVMGQGVETGNGG